MKWPDPLTRRQLALTLANQAKPASTRLQPRSSNNTAPSTPRINCRECMSFYITWETATPYGCRAHGFKSAQIPSMVVFSTSGEHCLLFRPKTS
jgi:hypothetical protein